MLKVGGGFTLGVLTIGIPVYVCLRKLMKSWDDYWGY